MGRARAARHGGGALSALVDPPLHDDLGAACAKLDRRKTNYRFDLERDIDWRRLDQPGLHVGPTLLHMLGVDLGGLDDETVLVFDWAYAIAVCEAFHDLEATVVRFTDDAATRLGPSRSVQWLGEEKRKHMALFERYAGVLRARRPDLARQWDRLPRSTLALPGSGEAEDAGTDPIAAHYVFWLNTLFFEEFTIFLAHCLERDRGLIQPTWASVHRYHMREEMQHLPTDMAHLDALVLSPAERLTLSKAFLFRVEEGFRVDFGLARATALLAVACPSARLPAIPPLRQLPLFAAMLQDKVFRRSRQAAPYLAELAGCLVQPAAAAGQTLSVLDGGPTPRPRAASLAALLQDVASRQPDLPITYLEGDGTQ